MAQAEAGLPVAADDVAALLRTWRQESGMSLGALGLKSGVSKAALSRWESGKARPRLTELDAVLDSLRVSPGRRAVIYAALGRPRAVRRLREMATAAEDAAPHPVTGDLLRAMRLRRRMTQEATAAAVGVRQGTLAKWERSEHWPGPERLDVLTAALGAHPEERAALLAGRFTAPAGVPTLEEIVERAEELRRSRPDAASRRLDDLNFLALEEALWHHAARSAATAAREVQLRVSALRMFSLLYQQRLAEAEPIAERTLRLGQALARGGWRDGGAAAAGTAALPLYAQSALVALAVARVGDLEGKMRRERLRGAVALLATDRQSVTHDRARAWLWRQAAHFHAELGEEDNALVCRDLSRTAADRARGAGLWDALSEQEDDCSHAVLLARVGRPEEALERAAAVIAAGDAQRALRAHLARAAAFARLGRRDAAGEAIRAARELSATADLPGFVPRIDRAERTLRDPEGEAGAQAPAAA